MGRIFGTDGARGVANTEISCKLATNIGRASAMVLAEKIGRNPKFVIAKDTRISSDMLEASIASGLCSVGADALLVGLAPTPAVSFLIEKDYADAGIMISASHNSYEFNGIKVFGPKGFKLTDQEEFEIEEIILDQRRPYSIRWGWELGRISRRPDLISQYSDYLVNEVGISLEGIRVAIDCANGSAVSTAGDILKRLGADVSVFSDKPDGININRDCGSTHIQKLSQIVAEDGGFSAGVAFDGDADRCIAVDEKGNIIDGDVIMAILAKDLKERGKLRDNTVVATVMSNLGLTKFAEQNGMRIEATKVGDRYVLEKMLDKRYSLGGEQSGHIIMLDHLNTGDGQLSAISLLGVMKRSGKKLSELASVMKVYPQVIMGIRADNVMKAALSVDPGAAKIIADAQAKLGSEGRVLVRASGTEPLIRVMLEGKDESEIKALANEIADALTERLGQNEECKKLEGF